MGLCLDACEARASSIIDIMKIFIGADHRGFYLKEILKNYLEEQGHNIFDLGNNIYDENDDYPDFASAVAKKVSENLEDRGIVICRSGVGVDIVANKFKGVRSILAFDAKQTILSRQDDDTNVLSLAADFISEEKAKEILDVWLKTDFSGEEKNKRRLEKIEKIEDNIN